MRQLAVFGRYKLLYYMQLSLRAQAFPFGAEMPADRVQRVREEMMGFLFAKKVAGVARAYPR